MVDGPRRGSRRSGAGRTSVTAETEPTGHLVAPSSANFISKTAGFTGRTAGEGPVCGRGRGVGSPRKIVDFHLP